MSLTLSMIELIILLVGAIIVGITLQLVIGGRALKKQRMITSGVQVEADEWKSRYEKNIEEKDKELVLLKQQVRQSDQNAAAFSRQAEELQVHNSEIESVIAQLEKKLENMEKEKTKPVPQMAAVQETSGRADYFDQLLFAQSRLMEQNDKINQALSNLEVLREREEKQRQVLRDNEELAGEIRKMRFELGNKEREINSMKQKEHLTREMASMLETAYGEFNTLQRTVQQLETRLMDSKKESLGYEEIKDGYHKLMIEMDDYKSKSSQLAAENLALQQELTSMRDKFRESDYQRQQLQKRIVQLGELNADLQLVADANKKLEGQLRQIGKIENMLNAIAEDRSSHLYNSDDK